MENCSRVFNPGRDAGRTILFPSATPPGPVPLYRRPTAVSFDRKTELPLERSFRDPSRYLCVYTEEAERGEEEEKALLRSLPDKSSTRANYQKLPEITRAPSSPSRHPRIPSNNGTRLNRRLRRRTKKRGIGRRRVNRISKEYRISISICRRKISNLAGYTRRQCNRISVDVAI